MSSFNNISPSSKQIHLSGTFLQHTELIGGGGTTGLELGEQSRPPRVNRMRFGQMGASNPQSLNLLENLATLSRHHHLHQEAPGAGQGMGLLVEQAELETNLLDLEWKIRDQEQQWPVVNLALTDGIFVMDRGKEKPQIAADTLRRLRETAMLVSKLVLVCSHPDKDHVSGLISLLSDKINDKLVAFQNAEANPPEPTRDTIASFISRTTSVFGNVAHVQVLNQLTGERFEAECEMSFLREKGIREEEEFSCTLTRKGGQTLLELTPLPPKVLSEEELEAISEEVDSRLK